MHNKVILIVLDGVGVGELPDAHLYNDEGSNTLLNVANRVTNLSLPNLQKFGLGNIIDVNNIPPAKIPMAAYGKMAAKSKGKDSTTGHWELFGLITEKEFPTYSNGFPKDLIEKFLLETGFKNILGNKAASGTDIIKEFGDEHLRTGFPIVYTSADSVFQIAAHEAAISLSNLYDICNISRNKVCVNEHAVGRIIARPFAGEKGNYFRTPYRRDYSTEPHGETLLDVLQQNNIPTIGIGKIDDLFAGKGLIEKFHTKTNSEGIKTIIQKSKITDRGIIAANLVDFDQLYGHRNDPVGFAKALEEFDYALPEIVRTLGPNDWLILTADHGNDPITPGTDHSREYVPVLIYSPMMQKPVNLGIRQTFADLGKTVLEIFHLNGFSTNLNGESFYNLLVTN